MPQNSDNEPNSTSMFGYISLSGLYFVFLRNAGETKIPGWNIVISFQ